MPALRSAMSQLALYLSQHAEVAIATGSVAVLVGLTMTLLFVRWRRHGMRPSTADTVEGGARESQPAKQADPETHGPARVRWGPMSPPEDPSGTDRLRAGLSKTRGGLLQRLAPLLRRRRLDETGLENLEVALLAADVGVGMTKRLLESVRDRQDGGGGAVSELLQRQLVDILEGVEAPASEPQARPHVIMVVGVNGAGKTTSIGKLACRYAGRGLRTMLVAGDTFRPAAIEQLAIWAERAGADLVRQQQGGDPGAVVFDGLRAAAARKVDIVIIDTAGRLHTKTNLMDELRKVRRVIAREVPGAPHETLLALDAVTGQNGLAQARAFVKELGADGVILTKLDGTAKGGVVVAIAGELGIPVRYVGVGEGLHDLRDFHAREFVTALFTADDRTSP
jgi:fused signal recognition particle receptor